jgi:predicted nuclease with TOPRIM domain
MEHSQYRHFSSQAQEGDEAVVMPAGDRDCTGSFTDQVKMTHALVRHVDEAIKEVKLLGEREEELSQKITELEALCKRLRKEAQKLKEENTKLEGMVESRDEIITEIAKEIGVDRMGEDVEAEDDDDDNEGDATAPQLMWHHTLLLHHLLLLYLRRSSWRRTL